MPTLQLAGKLGANAFGGEVAGDTLAMDYLSDTIKATLHTNTWVPNVDTHELKADAANELTTANGYTALGQALANKTVSYNATGGVTTFSADDFSWTASGGTLDFRYVVFWDDTPTGDPLIGWMDVVGSSANLSIAATIRSPWTSPPRGSIPRRSRARKGGPVPLAYFGAASNPAAPTGTGITSPVAVTPPGSMAAGDLVVLWGFTKESRGVDGLGHRRADVEHPGRQPADRHQPRHRHLLVRLQRHVVG